MKIEKLNESVKKPIQESIEFKVGQKVMYRGQETEILKIENDPEYGIDLLIKNPFWNGEDSKFENIWVADKVDLIEESIKTPEIINEALDFSDPLNPGRGACCPTAWECMDWIKDAVSHIDDERYTKAATNQLKYCAKNILDSKQSFENFNNYWNERFPAMIDFLDNQLAMIPRDIIASLNPDVVEEGLSDRIRSGDLNLEGEDDIRKVFSAEDDDTYIQLQDTELHQHEMRTDKDRWGNSYMSGRKNKNPRVASHTWGRAFDKQSGDVKQFSGPKYMVRAEMAKYLDSKK